MFSMSPHKLANTKILIIFTVTADTKEQIWLLKIQCKHKLLICVFLLGVCAKYLNILAADLEKVKRVSSFSWLSLIKLDKN